MLCISYTMFFKNREHEECRQYTEATFDKYYFEQCNLDIFTEKNKSNIFTKDFVTII